MKTIDFGMPTLIKINGIHDCIMLCKTLGLDFIELNMNLPQYQIEKLNTRMIKSISIKECIYFTIHLDERLDVCDFNKKVASAYTKTVLSAIYVAKKLNMPVINMHLSDGTYVTLPNEKVFLYNQYKDIYLEKLKNFRDTCEAAIDRSGIKICIENCGGFQAFSKEGIELLLESNVFALTLDIGHSYGAKDADEAFIYKHIDRLYHMHVHDGVGENVHLALGDGEIDIAEKLALAKNHNCRCVLETKTIAGLKQSVAKLGSYRIK